MGVGILSRRWLRRTESAAVVVAHDLHHEAAESCSFGDTVGLSEDIVDKGLAGAVWALHYMHIGVGAVDGHHAFAAHSGAG